MSQDYLAKHMVHEKLQAAVNSVLTTMPDNALTALASALGGKAAPIPKKPAAPAAAPAAPAATEAEISAQGDLVRNMKEANKATPGTYSKEDLDAAVAKLKALKGGGGGAPEAKKDNKDKKDKKEVAPEQGKGVSRPQGGGKKDKKGKEADAPSKAMGITTEPVNHFASSHSAHATTIPKESTWSHEEPGLPSIYTKSQTTSRPTLFRQPGFWALKPNPKPCTLNPKPSRK